MKKIILFFLTISLFFGATVLAQDLGKNDLSNVANKAGVFSASLETRVGGIISSVLAMLGTLFLILTIYAGILWMTASGEEAKIEKAKEIITAAVIGLAIVMSAYTITFFVGSKLQEGSKGSSTIGCCEYIPAIGTATQQLTTQDACDSGETETVVTIWKDGKCN